MIYGFYPTSCMCVSYKRTYFLSHVFYAFYQTFYKIFIVVSPTPHLPNIKLFKQTYHFQTFSYQSMKKRFIKQHKMFGNYNSRLLSCVFLLFFRSNIIYVKHSKRFVHLYVDEQTFCVICSLKILHLTCMLILSPRQGFEIANTQLVR